MHFPYSYLRRTLSGILALWSPDFPHTSRRCTRPSVLPKLIYEICLTLYIIKNLSCKVCDFLSQNLIISRKNGINHKDVVRCRIMFDNILDNIHVPSNQNGSVDRDRDKMRSSRSERRRRKQRNRRLAFVICTLTAVAIVITLFVVGYGDVYRNEAEFKEFADTQFKAGDLYDAVDIDKTEYEYGEAFSYAVEYSKCDDKDINAFRDKKIEAIKNEFSKLYVSSEESEENNGENTEEAIKKDEVKKALLLRTSIYETENGVINLAIYRTDVLEADKHMDIAYEDVYTYQFSKRTGDQLLPQQVFVEDYKEYCSDYFKEYFTTNYEQEELVEGWEQKLEPKYENFNEYIVTESGVTFFFEEGTVVVDTAGITCAGIAELQAEPILRKKILRRYIDPNRPMVALTYDDGPGLKSEDRILDCLEENNVVATFFYQGAFIDGREDKIERAKKIGCEIGHHTWSHPVLTDLETKDLKRQFDKTNEAIYDACGEYPTVFRPSYGETDSKVNKTSKLPVIMWSVDTVDWESRNGKKVFNLVKKHKNLDGDVILLHSIHDSTADATELLIPWLKEKGYQLVTVSELIKYKTGKDPVPGKVYWPLY